MKLHPLVLVALLVSGCDTLHAIPTPKVIVIAENLEPEIYSSEPAPSVNPVVQNVLSSVQGPCPDGMVITNDSRFGRVCSTTPEDILGKYNPWFANCKKLTARDGFQLGRHPCSVIMSIAVDTTLSYTGLTDFERQALLDSWLGNNGYRGVYLSSDQERLLP